MFGVEFTAFDKLKGCWTKPQPIPALVNNPIHGHIFRPRADGDFRPYEFRGGQADSRAISLELLDGPEDQKSLDFVLVVQSTVMLDKQDVISDFPYRTASWKFQVGVDGIVPCKGGTVHAARKDGKHQVSIDS
ncbi:2a1135c5-a2f7-4385-a9f2-4663a9df75c8 [Sclerotinia trifoliorum]|uniref:2a1135c5-a2f7-4385-a9f2-4663a9df75c8 n=1 Tax=Sclerotinia trifoliorum TaxID=28548 RepID=A0A8H2W2Q4_9HELO|nr:2a1135c5-a2f7-4385-a9f2-4663a9df75c8 [Sclerotinia trifoliorum]